MKGLVLAIVILGLGVCAACDDGERSCEAGTSYDPESDSCVIDALACGPGTVLEGARCVLEASTPRECATGTLLDESTQRCVP